MTRVLIVAQSEGLSTASSLRPTRGPDDCGASRTLAREYREILKNVRGTGVMLAFDVMRARRAARSRIPPRAGAAAGR